MMIYVEIAHSIEEISNVAKALRAFFSNESLLDATMTNSIADEDDATVIVSIDTIDDDLVNADYNIFDAIHSAFVDFVNVSNDTSAHYMIVDEDYRVIAR